MIKYYCDACGKELAQSRTLNKISYLCHIDDLIDHNADVYIDNDGNLISGRTEEIHTCAACYNKIMVPAVLEFRKIRKEHAIATSDS